MEGCVFKKRCSLKDGVCGSMDQKLRMVDDKRWIACSLEGKLEIDNEQSSVGV